MQNLGLFVKNALTKRKRKKLMIAIGAPLCAGAIVVTAMLMSHPALTATVSGGTQDFVYSTPNTTATNDYGGFATNTTYTIADQHDAFVYKDGRFDINPSGNPNQTFLAYCMRKELTAPPNGDTYTLDRNGSAGKRDNMASALALALASPDYGAKLSLEEFQQLFGYYPDGSFTGLGTGTDACTSEMRLILMNCFVWAYEDAVANNSPAFNPANPSTWHYVTDMNDWGDNLNSLSTTILTKDYLTTGLIKRIPPDYYPQIATRLLQMANQYYIANPSSSDPVSVLDITASFDTNTGQLSVGRSGYYPSVGDLPDGDTSYDLLLSCTGPSDIAIYVGGLDASNKVAGTTDIPIKPGDLIYIFGSGTVNMSVREQTRLSLVNGSIRGDILLNSSQESENYQPIITGYAKFGYPCRSLQIPCFPRKDINIPLRKTIAGDRPAGSFTFDFSVVMTDSNGAALTGAQAYSTTVSVPMDFTQTISQDFNVPLVLNQGTYYFKITETGYDTGSEWTSDTAPRYVRVTVNSGATPTTYEYRTNLADPWVTSTDATSAYRNFTNSYVKTTADATITYTKQVLGNPAGTSTTFSYRGIQLDASGNATGNWISLNSLTAPNNGTIVSTTATVRGFNKGVSYFLIEETGTEPSGWIYDRYRVAKVTVIDDTSTPLPGGLYALKVDSVDFVQYDLSSVKITDYTIDAKYTSGGFYPGNKTLTNNAFKNQCLSTTITYQKQVLGNPPGSSNYFPFKAIKIDASGAATGTWFNLPDAYGYTSGYGWGLTGLYNGTIGAYSKATISLSQLTLGDNYFLIAEQGTAPAGWIYDRYRVIEITTVVDTTQPSYALKLSTTPQYVEFDLSTVDIPGYTISTADLAPYQSGKTPAGDNTFKNQYVGIPYQKQVLGNPPGNYSYYPFRAIKIDASGASVGSWYNLPDGYGATSGSGWGLTGNFNGAITTYSKSSFPATDLVAGDNYFLIEELGTPPTGWIYDRYRVVKVTAQPGTDRPFDVTASYVEFDLNSVSIAGVALNDADIALYKEGKTPAGDDTFKNQYVGIPYQKQVLGTPPGNYGYFPFKAIKIDASGTAIGSWYNLPDGYGATSGSGWGLTGNYNGTLTTYSKASFPASDLTIGDNYFLIAEQGTPPTGWIYDRYRVVKVTVEPGTDKPFDVTASYVEFDLNSVSVAGVALNDADIALYKEGKTPAGDDTFKNQYVGIPYQKQVLGTPPGNYGYFPFRAVKIDASGASLGSWYNLPDGYGATSGSGWGLTGNYNGTITTYSKSSFPANDLVVGDNYYLIEEQGTAPTGWVYDRYRVVEVTVAPGTDKPFDVTASYVEFDLTTIKIAGVALNAADIAIYKDGKTPAGDNTFKNQYVGIPYQKQVLGNPPGNYGYFPFRAVKINASGASVGSWYNLPDGYGATSGSGWGLTGYYDGTITTYSKSSFPASGLTMGENYYLIEEQGTAPTGWLYDRYRVVEITVEPGTDKPYDVTFIGFIAFDLNTVRIAGSALNSADIALYKEGKTPAGDNTFKNQYVGLQYQKQVLGNPPGTYSYYPFRAIKIDASGTVIGSWYNLPDGQGTTSGSGWGLTGNYNGTLTTYSRASFPAAGLTVGDNYYLIEEQGTPPSGWLYDRYRVIEITVAPDSDGSAFSNKITFADFVAFDLSSITGVTISPADIANYAGGMTPADNTFKNQYLSASIPYQKKVEGNPSGGPTTFNFHAIEISASGAKVGDWFNMNALTANHNGTVASTSYAVSGLSVGLHYFLIEETGTAPYGWIYDRYRVAEVTVAPRQESTVKFIGFDLSQISISGYSIDSSYLSDFYPDNKTPADNLFRNAYRVATVKFRKDFPNPFFVGKTFAWDLIRLDAEAGNNTSYDPLLMPFSSYTVDNAVLSKTINQEYAADDITQTYPLINTVTLSSPDVPLHLGVNIFKVTERANATSGGNWDGWTHDSRELYVRYDVNYTDVTEYWWSGSAWVPATSPSADIDASGFRNFVNQYDTEVKSNAVITLKATKKLNIVKGVPGSDTEFSFTLTQVTDATGATPTPDGITRTVTTTGSATGTVFAFDPIQISSSNLNDGFTYFYYKIEESPVSSGSGWEIDTHPCVLTVRVYHSASGSQEMYAEVTEKNGVALGHAYDPASDLVFTNTYDNDAAFIDIAGDKVITGYDSDTCDKEFTFTATQVDALGSKTAAGDLAGATTLAGAGKFHIVIGNLKPGNTYYFMVTEKDESDRYWSYSKNIYWVEVAVTSGSGSAVAKITNTQGSSTFTNNYTTGGGNFVFPVMGGGGKSVFALAATLLTATALGGVVFSLYRRHRGLLRRGA